MLSSAGESVEDVLNAISDVKSLTIFKSIGMISKKGRGSATVDYADGVTVRQVASTTDPKGKASISWQIENQATLGSFSVTFEVSAAAYITE